MLYRIAFTYYHNVVSSDILNTNPFFCFQYWLYDYNYEIYLDKCKFNNQWSYKNKYKNFNLDKILKKFVFHFFVINFYINYSFF